MRRKQSRDVNPFADANADFGCVAGFTVAVSVLPRRARYKSVRIECPSLRFVIRNDKSLQASLLIGETITLKSCNKSLARRDSETAFISHIAACD